MPPTQWGCHVCSRFQRYSSYKYFSTRFDNQLSVLFFFVYEGERAMVADNNLLDEFSVRRIPTARCGVPDLKVVFEVDVDGILKCHPKT